MNTLIVRSLLNIRGISRKSVYKLYTKLDTFEDLEFTFFSLKKLIGKRIDLLSYADFLEIIEKTKLSNLKDIEKGIKILSIFDEQFPDRFRDIQEPPVIIYVQGNLEKFNRTTNIAIIGTRNPSEHGAEVAKRLGSIISSYGYPIVSGLAKGVDEFAHISCLRNKGQAVGVLSYGFLQSKNISNGKIVELIKESEGLLLTEYPPGTTPNKGYFIERDRLISAFSEAIVVVETKISGGTMHTVNFAKSQGKLVACYRHPERYQNDIRVQGNQRLLLEEGTYSIDSLESIENLTKSARAANEKRISSLEVIESHHNQKKLYESCSTQMDLYHQYKFDL